MMMKSFVPTVVKVMLALMAVLLWSNSVLAVENSLVVELPKRINARIHKILETQRTAEVQSRQIEERIKNIVEQVNLTTDKEEIFRLQKHYIDLRAKALEIVTYKIVSIENDFGAIAKDLRKLETVQKDSDRFGIGQAISRDDPVAKRAIQETFQGFGNLLDMVQKLDPSANVENIRTSLNTMDEVALRFFKSAGEASMQEQQSFIKEAMVASRAVQRFIGVERDYLMRKLYYIDARNLIRQFGQLKEVVFAGLEVTELFNGLHRQDDEVFEVDDDPVPSLSRWTGSERQLGQWD